MVKKTENLKKSQKINFKKNVEKINDRQKKNAILLVFQY